MLSRILSVVALLACACSAPEGTARVELDLPSQAANLVGSPFASALLHGDQDVSVSLLRLSAPITLHRHRGSEEVVYLLSGEGTLQLAQDRHELHAGDFVVVPRNTPHGFTPTGPTPAVLLQLFTPHFVEGDREQVGEAK